MINYIEQMIVSATDICNMNCDFCLRGYSTNRKADIAMIPRIFEGIDHIGSLTITGGEPSCYPEYVTAIVDYLVKHKDSIYVDGFFIATNGKIYCQELVDAIKTMMFIYLEKRYGKDRMVTYDEVGWFNMSGKEELSSFAIAVSMDMYHEPIKLMNYIKYRTSGVYSFVKERDYSKGGVIARGGGSNIPYSFMKAYQGFHLEHDKYSLIANEIYITSDGKVFGDCDMSTDMEEDYQPAGLLSEETLIQILERHAEEEGD